MMKRRLLPNKLAGTHGRTVLITPAMINQIKSWAMVGMSDEQIGCGLGMSSMLFILKKRQYPQILKVIAKGRAEGLKLVADAHFHNATHPALSPTGQPVGPPAGDVRAQQFFLKARGGWREDDPAQTNVTINLPPLFRGATAQGVDELLGVVDEQAS